MKNLRISTKLLIGFSIVITLTSVIGAVGIFGLLKIDKSYTEAYNETALPLPIVANAIEKLTIIGIRFRDAIIYMNDPDIFPDDVASISEAITDFEYYAEQYSSKIAIPASREAFDIAWDIYQNEYKPAVMEILSLTQAENQIGAIKLLEHARETRLTVAGYLHICLQNDTAEGDKNSKNNTDLSRSIVLIFFTVIISVIVVSIIIAFYLSDLISKPVIFMKDVLSRIGLKGAVRFSDEEYDQTEQYAACKDEVGQSVEMLLVTVRRLVKVSRALEMVAAGDLSGELELLSDMDVMGISLQKMTENLNTMFYELEQQAVALREARDIAEQNSYYKSEFLSRMSHEIRTPMNAIIGMTNLAKNANNIERKDYCLSKIDSASMHLLGVINDVLDMSKIEAGKFDLSNAEFNIEKMLIKVTNVVNFRIDEKEQSLHIKVDQDVPVSIVSDEQRLSQVITNLLTNANKFTPNEGTITLYVRMPEKTANFCTLEFEVKDNGIGITEEQQKKLFRPFEQADGTISRKYGGTGLGLAISKRIVELLGGSIRIESEPEKGSSFIFTIRAEIGRAIQKSLPVLGMNWDDLRILAVDDDNNVREFFSHMVNSYKIKCQVASGGDEALDLIGQQGPFNIVFVDWKMPEMDGITLAKEIKERYGANTVVIMISAVEWSVIEPEARHAGIDGFISKPLFGSLIVDCINEHVDLRQQPHAEGGVVTCEGCFVGKHILLAEDIEVNSEIFTDMLEHTGIRIDRAEDGGAVYRMFKDNPYYDLIFMDIHMPEINGYEATKMIRALDIPQAKSVPIIAMTASVFKEDVERCLASGMNDHIGKPIWLDSVIDKLKQYLLK